MKRLLVVLLSVVLSSLGVGCNATNTNGSSTPTFANLAGSWNLVLTPDGATSPAYTLGLSIAQSGDVATANQIPITLPTGYGGSCVDYSDPVTISGISATGATITITSQSNGNAERPDITIDDSCTIVISFNAIAVSASGTYTENGTNGQAKGAAVMTRQ